MAEPLPFPFRTTAILRGVEPGEVVQLGRRAWSAGFDLVEIPLQGPASLRALETLAASVDAGAVGAGTICNPAEVRRAINAGAQALVAPGFDPAVTDAASESGLPLLPGVFSPSEVMAAREMGHRVVKLFPAGTLGAGYVRALRGPFPDMRFVVVGGVGPGALPEFATAGAWGVGVGGDLEAFLADPSVLNALPPEA
jgi:2-dehydro-3-deoxyphosphogluconate aldolase / (4S)-4-hydroxy-2-oxoglutarate aldolase